MRILAIPITRSGLFRPPVQPNTPMVILSLGMIGMIGMIGMPHFTHGLSHGFPFQIQLVTVVQKAVEDGVSQRRIMQSLQAHNNPWPNSF